MWGEEERLGCPLIVWGSGASLPCVCQFPPLSLPSDVWLLT